MWSDYMKIKNLKENFTMYSISNREYENKASQMAEELIADGWRPMDSRYTGSKYYIIFAKKEGDAKALWKAVQYSNQLEPRVIDITYEQGIGREPIDDFDGLRRDLGRMLLPKREGLNKFSNVHPDTLEPRQRTAVDGVTWWVPFDTTTGKYVTTLMRLGHKFKTKKACQQAIDRFKVTSETGGLNEASDFIWDSMGNGRYRVCYKPANLEADVYTDFRQKGRYILDRVDGKIIKGCQKATRAEVQNRIKEFADTLTEATNRNFYVTVYAQDSKSGPEEGGYVTYGWDAISSKSFRDEEAAKRYQKDFVDGAEILSDDGRGCLVIRDEWEDEYRVCVEPAHRRGKANAPARSWAESELDIKPARPYFDRQGKRVAENPRVTRKRERDRIALNKEFEDRLNSVQTRDELIDIISDSKYVDVRKDHLELIGAISKRLTEAKYGGAFDIADDQFFTREDINSAAEEVLAHVQETFSGEFVLAGCWFENGTFIVNIQDSDFNEYEAFAHVTMRKIRKPEDLKKYALGIASKIIEQIKEDKGMSESKLNETSTRQLDQRRKDLYGRIRDRLGTDDLMGTRGQWTQDEADEDVELSTISMIQSICAYADGVPTVDEVMENRYMKSYIGQLGKEKVRAIVERELEHFSRANVRYAFTDSEGVPYNTIDYPEDRMNEATYPRNFKLGEKDIQYVKVYNQYGYTIQEIRIDNVKKTFKRGNFSIGHDKAYKNRQVYEDFIEELIAQGYTEIPSDYRCLRNKTRKGVPMTEGDMPTAIKAVTNDLVKDWYIDKYTTDELGDEITDGLTFDDVYSALKRGDEIYGVIGVNDSIVRERIFHELSRRRNVDYDVIYDMWLDGEDGGLDDLIECQANPLTEDYDTCGSWSVEFDLTLEGEEVSWEDLSETTQEHIADCILDGVVQGEIVEYNDTTDDTVTGWWVAHIECYLDDEGDVLFDSLDEASQEHIADSIRDGYTSGELCVTREGEELTEAPAVRLSGDDLNNPNDISFKKIIKRTQDEEDEKARQAEYTRRKKEATEKYAGLLDDVATMLDSDEDKTKALDLLFDALVPPEGKCDTVAGEIVRALMRLVARYYNDGDYFFMGYGLDVAAPSVAYLQSRYEDIISDADAVAKHYTDYLDDKQLEDDYEKFLNDLICAVVEDIQTHPELLVEPNDDDYLKADTEEIEDNQPRFTYDFMVGYEIRELYDADIISRRDIEEYAEDAFRWESVYDGVEVSVDGDYVYVDDLTYDGLVALKERLSNRGGRDGIDDFWAELLEQNQDAYDRLQNGDEEEDEDEDELTEAIYSPDCTYVARECSYEKASEIALMAKRALKLSAYETEMLEHDINNLRANEWVDEFAALSDSSKVKKLFFTFAVKCEEDLAESYPSHHGENEDKPYTYEQVEAELRKMTNNFTVESGAVSCFFREEKDYGRDVLKQYYKVVEVSDGRRSEDEPMSYVIAFAERDNKK